MADQTVGNDPGALRARLETLEAAIDGLPVGVAILYLDGRPILANRKFREIYRIKDGPLESASFGEMIDRGLLTGWKEDPRQYFERLMRTLRAGRSFTAQVEIGDRIIAVHDAPLANGLMVSTQEDITGRVMAERSVAFLAHHDVLTQLPNRAAFQARLESVLEDARTRRKRFALLSVDLDRFKDVNDVFGHSVGDALLQEVAKRFRDLAPDAFPARLGGDEFTFIDIGEHQPTSAAAMAERLLANAGGEMTAAGRQLLVSLSIGVALFPQDGEDAVTLLNNADAALYRAKAEGRGLIRFYDRSMDERIHKHRRLQQDLRLALPRGEISLFYQPQAQMNGEITGFEALARWSHATLGEIEPTEFIPLAEENGLIIDIGDWIMRRACTEAASWEKPLEISVNVSPIQFRHGDLAARIGAILRETGLAPERLEVEITEGVLIENHARALATLGRLKAMGVRIAMDDFGTGYSSLSYLQSFPFDKLKIDQSFIERLNEDDHAKEIVRAVIGLGRSLKLPTVAEGVETSDQFRFLHDANCSGVQGFYVGRPQPIASYRAVVGAAPAAEAEPRSRAG